MHDKRQLDDTPDIVGQVHLPVLQRGSQRRGVELEGVGLGPTLAAVFRHQDIEMHLRTIRVTHRCYTVLRTRQGQVKGQTHGRQALHVGEVQSRRHQPVRLVVVVAVAAHEVARVEQGAAPVGEEGPSVVGGRRAQGIRLRQRTVIGIRQLPAQQAPPLRQVGQPREVLHERIAQRGHEVGGHPRGIAALVIITIGTRVRVVVRLTLQPADRVGHLIRELYLPVMEVHTDRIRIEVVNRRGVHNQFEGLVIRCEGEHRRRAARLHAQSDDTRTQRRVEHAHIVQHDAGAEVVVHLKGHLVLAALRGQQDAVHTPAGNRRGKLTHQYPRTRRRVAVIDTQCVEGARTVGLRMRKSEHRTPRGRQVHHRCHQTNRLILSELRRVMPCHTTRPGISAGRRGEISVLHTPLHIRSRGAVLTPAGGNTRTDRLKALIEVISHARITCSGYQTRQQDKE